MINKEKLVLVAMISMLLPGASTEAFAEGSEGSDKNAAKKATIAPKKQTASPSSDRILSNSRKQKANKQAK